MKNFSVIHRLQRLVVLEYDLAFAMIFHEIEYHQMSCNHEKRRNDTELSKHLWKLKEKKEGYSISWKIIAKAKSYSNTTKRCNLCITEKFFILSNPQMATLNKRNELIAELHPRAKRARVDEAP